MTDFIQNISKNNATTETTSTSTSAENLPIQNDGEATDDAPFIVNAPRVNSKLILQNMEEVLNSVKKKHRQKHRRLKEQKKIAQMEAADAAIAVSKSDVAISAECPRKCNNKIKTDDLRANNKHKNALQEKSTLENDVNYVKSKYKSRKSPTKSVAKGTNESILKHFQRTPKKGDELVGNKGIPVKANAFEVMMNAQNKSIGSNTPGKEPALLHGLEEKVVTVNVKRRLMLQEWAEQKGGAKRKLDEDARAAYVEYQLDQRAKRFKQMLVNGESPKTDMTPEKQKTNETKPTTRKKLKAAQRSNKASTEKLKKRSKASHTQRQSSIDSVEVIELNTTNSISEELLKKESPTKKSDSLLEYLQKKEPSSQIVNDVPSNIQIKTETPKRRPRREQDMKNLIIDNGPTTSTPIANYPELDDSRSTPNTRPKRSCVGKARYDYDLEESPKKQDKLKRSSPIATPTLKEKNEEKILQQPNNIDVIAVDDNSLNSLSSTQQLQEAHKKLAPLFVRTIPKPIPDAQVLKARREFLRSGVPEKLRLEQVKQKQFEQSCQDAFELFPKITHVCQHSQEEEEYLKHIKEMKLSVKLKNENDNETISNTLHVITKRKSKSKLQNFGTFINCTLQDFNVNGSSVLPVSHIPLPSLENKRNIIKSWKTEFQQFPTYKCYNQMREKYRYFSAIDSAQDTEQVSESLVVTRHTRRSLEIQKKLNSDSPDDAKPPPTAPNGELLFTEKYKPLTFEQIFVNLAPVTQLKEFLSNWSTGQNNIIARNSQNINDTFEFANDSNSSQAVACNSVVLLGPVSSGKTNAVFALANELNFNVLEINAGMRRTGKKLIQELQEATQSHQIRKESKAQKQLLKMSMNSSKSKKQSQSSINCSQSNDGDSNLSDQSNARKCLILIEDADIVFEQYDAGFIDAIYTLAASSKRPVIVVASNPNCYHLQRLMQQNTIVFNAPNILNISKFLSVLSLIENCPIQLDDLISLHLYNRKDLRKTLMELQFYIQSGGDRDLQQRQINESPKKLTQKNVDDQKYFALSNCGLWSEERNVNTNSDDSLQKHLKSGQQLKNDDSEVYMHRTLFEFYTLNQNERWRIPFPVDFNLLHTNLNEIFKASVLTRETKPKITTVTTRSSSIKRTSRSPKKEWLNTATAATAKVKTHAQLSTLCEFYENISVAALVNDSYGHDERDRLKTDFSEYIAHNLVEQSLVTNLKADFFPYNLFNTPKPSLTIYDNLSSVGFQCKRARSLDIEPMLRNICRSEKLRATLERRSTRFYHYLRNISINMHTFCTDHYDNACGILECEQDNLNTETTDVSNRSNNTLQSVAP